MHQEYLSRADVDAIAREIETIAQLPSTPVATLCTWTLRLYRLPAALPSDAPDVAGVRFYRTRDGRYLISSREHYRAFLRAWSRYLYGEPVTSAFLGETIAVGGYHPSAQYAY